MSSIACRQCNQPITFDNKHISQRTGKKIPLDPGTNEPLIVLYGVVVNNYSNNHNNKGDTTNATKAVVRKSILMQITRAKAANGFY